MSRATGAVYFEVKGSGKIYLKMIKSHKRAAFPALFWRKIAQLLMVHRVVHISRPTTIFFSISHTYAYCNFVEGTFWF